MQPTVQIRFLKDARGGEWHKGDRGTIDRSLGVSRHDPPCDVYIIRLKNGEEVWAKSTEFENYNQLTIWEDEGCAT